MAESQLTMLMVAINNLAGVKIVNERDMAISHFHAVKYGEENTELKDRLNEIAATGSYEELASVLLKDGIVNKSQDWRLASQGATASGDTRPPVRFACERGTSTAGGAAPPSWWTTIIATFSSYEVNLFIYNDEGYCLLHDIECEKNYLQQQEWVGTGYFLKDYLCTKLKPRGFVPEDWKLTNETIVEIIGFLRDLHDADGLLTKIIGLLDDMCYDDDRSDAKIDHIISLIKELGY